MSCRRRRRCPGSPAGATPGRRASEANSRINAGISRSPPKNLARRARPQDEAPEWCIEAPVAEQHDESESSSGPDKPDTETHEVAGVEAEASAEDEVVHEPDAISASPPKKKKKKRAEPGAPEPIRDRNRRLREEAAGQRRTKLEQRSAPVRSLEAGEIVDDALARGTAAAGEWLKKNFNVVQWFVVAGIVAWVGYAIYSYRADKAAQLASAKLTAAVRAEDARIGPDDSKPDPQSGIVETRPAYPSDADRLRI